jgi:hypothetical protein
MSRGRDRWDVRGEVSIVAHAQQLPDEGKAMRLICYLICALAGAIWLGLWLYAMFLRQIGPLDTGSRSRAAGRGQVGQGVMHPTQGAPPGFSLNY